MKFSDYEEVNGVDPNKLVENNWPIDSIKTEDDYYLKNKNWFWLFVAYIF